MPSETIAEIYEAIFNDDPLLLKDKNQSKYAAAMLKHLLVHRPLTTTEPFPIDLHDPADIAAFKRVPKQPKRPKRAVSRRYRDARRDRQKVSESDFNELKKVTMVADGSLTRRRRRDPEPDFTPLQTQDAAEASLDDAAKRLFARRFRIAAVGYRLQVSRADNNGYLSEELCALPEIIDKPVPRSKEDKTESQLGRTRLKPRSAIGPWEDSVLMHIGKALDRRSDIIMLPEFALPTSQKVKGKEPIVSRIRRVCENNKKSDCYFLFAGTRHEERYNRGLILSKRDGEVSDDWWHYKVASARGLGENIMGPFSKSLPSYQTSFKIGTNDVFITVAICYDTYDPTTFLNIVLEAVNSLGKRKAKVILVPSFNPSADFVALLRDISFLARCTVIYVNALHGDAKMFISGFAISDIAIPEKFLKLKDSIKSRLNSLPPAPKNTRGWGGVRQPPQVFGNKADDKRETLEKLLMYLERFEERGSLNNLVTIEGCILCEEKSHQYGDQHCGRDLLYYNIELELIELLTDFRRFYFGDEGFLPIPLQYSELTQTIQGLVDDAA